ncbi:MAG: TIGR04222 domain-containing membrane protein [Erythrobacter sp.]|nr:TIGR04222 domain-containing membrane protein [Erythrobacter sp.]
MQLFSSWTGSDFLLFYIMLLVLCTCAACWIPAHLRAAGRRGESPDAEDLAMLAGGRATHTDSVIADLYARGGLEDSGKGTLGVTDPGLPASPAGRALLGLREPFSRSEAEDLLAAHAIRVAARLRRQGMMLRPDQLNRLRWLSIAPFGALFVLGIYRLRAGSTLGEPTEYLAALLVLTVALAVFRWVRFDRRTAAGIEAVKDLRANAPHLRSAPPAGEAAMAVALFGTGVLVGTPWEPVHALRHKASKA